MNLRLPRDIGSGPASVLVAVVLVALCSCTGSARTDDAYAGKAATTMDEVRSAVETAVVAVEAADEHSLPAAYVSVLLADAEDDAVGADGTFASIQPPSDRSDDVRERSRELIGDAVDAVADLRIRSRRGDLEALTDALPKLRDLSAQLESRAAELRRRADRRNDQASMAWVNRGASRGQTDPGPTTGDLFARVLKG